MEKTHDLPSNYVTLVQLEERWKERKRKEKEAQDQLLLKQQHINRYNKHHTRQEQHKAADGPADDRLRSMEKGKGVENAERRVKTHIDKGMRDIRVVLHDDEGKYRVKTRMKFKSKNPKIKGKDQNVSGDVGTNHDGPQITAKLEEMKDENIPPHESPIILDKNAEEYGQVIMNASPESDCCGRGTRAPTTEIEGKLGKLSITKSDGCRGDGVNHTKRIESVRFHRRWDDGRSHPHESLVKQGSYRIGGIGYRNPRGQGTYETVWVRKDGAMAGDALKI